MEAGVIIPASILYSVNMQAPGWNEAIEAAAQKAESNKCPISAADIRKLHKG